MIMTLAQKLLRNLFQSVRSFTWELVEKLFLYFRPTIHCNGVSQLDMSVFIGTQKSVEDGKIPSKKVKVELSDSGMGFDFLKLKY